VATKEGVCSVASRGELAGGGEISAPPNVLLSGIVGSVAYGLDTEDSDVDRLGVFAARTERLLGLHPVQQSVVSSKPDATYHEAGKFAALALKVNPTITELLWLPDELYEVRTKLGDGLRSMRHCFLSRKAVRNAYLGYATQQFRRLENRGDGSFSADTRKRTAKHARHLLRLLAQGTTLHFGEQVAAGNIDLARERLARAEIQFDVPSALAEEPAEEAVEAWLQAVRRAYYEMRAA
jgi:predicted nucleotidyltransferase